MLNTEATKYIWHPFTQMKTAAPPVHISRAKDCTLFAEDGTQYIDAIASWWVNIHGHCNEYIAGKIAAQANTLEHVIFAGFTHTPAIQLANTLIHILPDHFAKVFFSDDGSTCVEVALKMAIQYWHNQGISHKTKIIAFKKAFHGRTSLAVAVTDNPNIVAPVNQTDNVIFLPFNDEAALEQAFQQHEISSVIMVELLTFPLPLNATSSEFKTSSQIPDNGTPIR